MDIQPAKESQLLEVLYIIRECAEQLTEKGVKSWHNTHIDFAEISKDIKKKTIYIIFQKRIPVGTITIKPDENDRKVNNIDRLAIFPVFQRRGYAKAMIDFAEDLSRKSGFSILRGTTPVDDLSLRKLLENKGFGNVGTSQSPNELMKVIFEKKIG
jgi:GNAT superfamily N-acetyltransferase